MAVQRHVKEAFNAVFEGQNKSAIVTQSMREAVERAERKERSQAAITRILRKARGLGRIMRRGRRVGRP